MTRIILLASLLCLLVACTDSEQQAMMERNKQSAQVVHIVPEPAETPAEPAQEPQKHFETSYWFTSSTEKQPIKCGDQVGPHECGMSFTGCGDDRSQSYYCQTGVRVTMVNEEVKDSN